MFTAARRVPALLLIPVLLVGAMPAAAADPSTVPAHEAAVELSPDAPTSPPTIHAEMLAAPPDGPSAPFVEGAVPEPLPAPEATIQGGDARGGIASLPNGLTREVYGYLPYWALDPSLRQYLRYDLV